MDFQLLEMEFAALRMIGGGPPARRIREAAGYSQDKVAKLLGVSQPALSRYESGDRRPDAQTAIRWMNTLIDIQMNPLRTPANAA